MSVDTVSDNTSIDNEIDNFFVHTYSVRFSQKSTNFMKFHLKHVENQEDQLLLLNERIRTIRIRQVELMEQIESLPQEEVNEVLQLLIVNEAELVEAEHNIVMYSQDLQNIKKYMNKLYQDGLSKTKQKTFLHTNSAGNGTNIETDKEES